MFDSLKDQALAFPLPGRPSPRRARYWLLRFISGQPLFSRTWETYDLSTRPPLHFLFAHDSFRWDLIEIIDLVVVRRRLCFIRNVDRHHLHELIAMVESTDFREVDSHHRALLALVLAPLASHFTACGLSRSTETNGLCTSEYYSMWSVMASRTATFAGATHKSFGAWKPPSVEKVVQVSSWWMR